MKVYTWYIPGIYYVPCFQILAYRPPQAWQAKKFSLACVHLAEHHDAFDSAVTFIPLCVGGDVAKMLIVLKGVWNSGVIVAADETLNEGCLPLPVHDRN
jgi:hypothetical protein